MENNESFEQVFEELQNKSQNPELIKDNKFYFEYDNKWYRVRMPSQKELSEANQKRNQLKIQMLQKGKKEGFLLKKDLIIILKENGVDIEAMDNEIEKIKEDIIQIALTASRKKDSEEDILETLENNTKENEQKIRSIINEKMTHLSSAIEYQAEDIWYKVLISHCTEKAIDESKEKWEKLWKSFDEFQKDNSNFPYIAEAHFCSLLQNG